MHARLLTGSLLALLLTVLLVPARSSAVRPTGHDVAVGPPARLQPFDPTIQARLTASSQALWQLQEAEPGTWYVRWDQGTGRARTLLPPGVAWPADGAAIDEARAFVDRHPGLFGVPSRDLVTAQDVVVGATRYVVLGQRHEGLEVDGASIEFRARIDAGGARLFLVRNRLVPIGRLDAAPLLDAEGALHAAMAYLAPEPAHVLDPGRLVVFPGVGPAPLPRVAWRSRIVLPALPMDLTTWIDARTGELLGRFDAVRHDVAGTITVEHEERTIDDPMVASPAPWIDVTGPGGATTTDAIGWWTIPGDAGDVTAAMQGPTIVLHDGGTSAPTPAVTFAAADGVDTDLVWVGSDASIEARDAFASFEVVRAFTELRWPTLSWLSDAVSVTVNDGSDSCNAYYWGGQIQFLEENPGWGCVDFARIADVMYHEYGHGLHDHLIVTGFFDGTISEGSSDYVSATINDDPLMAIGAYGPGTWIREIETDKVYPTDLIGEVHADGLIWASALWDLRDEMIALYGYEDGVETTDLLVMGALQGGPNLTDGFEELVIADDDNGDVTDGTPHLCLISDVMTAHGIGPGPLGFFLYDHDTLPDQPTDALSYPVEATFVIGGTDCSNFDVGQVRVRYATDPAGPFDEALLAFDGVDAYSGAIPRFPAGTTVHYWIAAGPADEFTSHGFDQELMYRFYVGELTELFCDDLESGDANWFVGTGDPGSPDPDPGDWELGAPQGLGGDPAAAFSGATVWGTDLSGDGIYTNLTSQFLSLTPQPVGDAEQIFLRYRRWLTVEDGLYDHARLFVNATPVWENAMTGGGTVHHVDTAWVVHEIDVSALVDDDGNIGVTWTLESDPGLEMGGWTLDDVCLVAPQDLEPLYVVEDFDASDGDLTTTTLSWTQPPVLPLWAVAVVRNGDHYPESLDDGVVVHLDPEPSWGAQVVLVDDKLQPGGTWYYRVFAADEQWNWKGDLVVGGNADTATTAQEGDDDDATADDDDATPDDDDATPDDDDATPDDDDAADDDDATADDDDAVLTGEGCDCDGGSLAGGGHSSLLALFAGLAIVRRRRSRVSFAPCDTSRPS
jgi:hypothetical protein